MYCSQCYRPRSRKLDLPLSAKIDCFVPYFSVKQIIVPLSAYQKKFELKFPIQFQLIWQNNWTWITAQLIIDLFWAQFKVNSDRMEWFLSKKRKNWHHYFSRDTSLISPKVCTILSWLTSNPFKTKFHSELHTNSSSAFVPMSQTWVQHCNLNLNWTF